MGERVKLDELARRMQLHRRTIHKWIENGRLSPPDADGWFDLDQARAERDASESPLPHHQARKAQIDEAKAAKTKTPPPDAPQGPSRGSQEGSPVAPPPVDPVHAPNTPEKLGLALKLETYKLQKAKAEMQNLELDKAAGLLIDRSEVEHVLADLGATLRSELEGLADRLSPTLAGLHGDVNALHKHLDDYAREVLGRIADHMQRQAGISP